MTKLTSYLKNLETDIQNLPIDTSEANFSEQRLEKLGIIYGTILEIGKVFGKEYKVQESIISIQEQTSKKIQSITDEKVKHELLYKLSLEEDQLEEILKTKGGVFNEIEKIVYTISKSENKGNIAKIKDLIHKYDFFKKIIMNIRELTTKKEQEEIEELFKKHESFINEHRKTQGINE